MTQTTVAPRLRIPSAPLPIVHPVDSCTICGCTQERACPDGCSWYVPGLCTACVQTARYILSGGAPRLGRVHRAIQGITNRNLLAWCQRQAREEWRWALLGWRLADLAATESRA